MMNQQLAQHGRTPSDWQQRPYPASVSGQQHSARVGVLWQSSTQAAAAVLHFWQERAQLGVASSLSSGIELSMPASGRGMAMSAAPSTPASWPPDGPRVSPQPIKNATSKKIFMSPRMLQGI